MVLKGLLTAFHFRLETNLFLKRGYLKYVLFPYFTNGSYITLHSEDWHMMALETQTVCVCYGFFQDLGAEKADESYYSAKKRSVLSGKENKTQDLSVAAHFIKRTTWVRKLWSSRQLMHYNRKCLYLVHTFFHHPELKIHMLLYLWHFLGYEGIYYMKKGAF